MRSHSYWLQQATEAHSSFYDYSKSETKPWRGMQTEVTIVCPAHGPFIQLAASHAIGKGCQQCYWDRSALARRSTIDEWVDKARAVWGDLYDYSQSVYVDSHSPIIILCSEHGAFSPVAREHVRADKSNGCPSCSKYRPVTAAEWVDRARRLHGNLYDYSKAHIGWTGVSKRVTIGCQVHGDFQQFAYVHAGTRDGKESGAGCSKCAHVEGGKRTSRLFAEDPERYSSWSRKEYKWGKDTLRLQGYEPQALDHLRSLGYKRSQVKATRAEGVPLLSYMLDKRRNYMPDLYLPEEDTVVEVKSTYTWFADNSIEKNKAKLSAARLRHNVWLLIMNEDGTVHTSIRKDRLKLNLPPVRRR